MSIMKYETKITLYNSYFDANENITPKSILSIFQDVAGLHAEEIGVGFSAMYEKNLYWVLSRVKYDILKMPQPNQTVIVETWPHEKGRIDFDRDMKILDENGEVLIIGTSKWCVINTETRSLQRSDNVNYIGEVCPDINYPEKFNKLTVPNFETTNQLSYIVKFCDIDHNKHMNNTNYGTIILNSVKNKSFSHFEINFVSESLLDDEISVSTLATDDGEFVIGTNNEKTTFVAFTK